MDAERYSMTLLAQVDAIALRKIAMVGVVPWR